MKFAAKHPGISLDESIATHLREIASDGKVSCTDALELAEKTGRDPADIGVAMDLMEYRIIECKLMLFGYLEKKKVELPAEEPDPAIVEAIKNAAKDNRISCKSVFEIAEQFNMAKPDMVPICNFLNIKIRPCQLGGFKPE